jgi:histidinol-phosphate aminotransferase
LEDIQPKIDLILSQRSILETRLTDAGWKLPPAEANFIYLATGDRTDGICLELERRGVVVRPFSGDGIRVTVGSAEENERFLDTLADVATP